jgi:uncharacterized SAM-binding protein YcdF (DUF218 family)
MIGTSRYIAVSGQSLRAGPQEMSLRALAITLLLPPLGFLLLGLVGLSISRGWHRGSRILVGIGLAGLLVLAVPAVPDLMLVALERSISPAPGNAAPPAAIVILSGDARLAAGSPLRTVLGPLTLERLRCGAELARATGLPVLVTGGSIDDHGEALGSVMARDLIQDFGVPVRWVEATARDTWENAALSEAMLRQAGIGSVFVVTQGWHMPRALTAFRHLGLVATPAATPLNVPPRLGWAMLVPQASAWTRSYYAMHEWIGLLWYQMRVRAGS